MIDLSGKKKMKKKSIEILRLLFVPMGDNNDCMMMEHI